MHGVAPASSSLKLIPVPWSITRKNGTCPHLLEPVSEQDPAFRAERSLAVLSLDAAAQLDDVALQLFVRRDFDDHPLETNRFVCKDRPPESHPEFQAQHGPGLRKVRGSQREQERCRVWAARSRSAKT